MPAASGECGFNACLVVPLTGRLKTGKYYFPVGAVNGRNATAVLSQIRFVDRKRLAVKIAMLDQDTFDDLRSRGARPTAFSKTR